MFFNYNLDFNLFKLYKPFEKFELRMKFHHKNYIMKHIHIKIKKK